MWTALSMLSFFVGGVLLLLVSISLLDPKKQLKSSGFFLATLAIAGVQRVGFGLVSFQLLGPSISSAYRPLSFVYFATLIYYFFFESLYHQKKSDRKLIFHFGFALLIVALSIGMNWSTSLHQTVFLAYSSVYYVSLAYLVWTYTTKRKSQRELQYFKSIRIWGYLMFGSFTVSYVFSNFILGRGVESIQNYQNQMLEVFFGLTSFLWLFIAYYLLRNPVILYGELRLLDQINRVAPEEITIWRAKKKGPTGPQDLVVEKQIAPRLESLIFDLKNREQAWTEELLEVPTLKALSFALDCPQSHLKYLFKYYGNYTYGEYVNVLKINYAISLIREGFLLTHTSDSLSKKVLYLNYNSFFLNFKKLMGESPTDFHAQLQQEKRGT
jgi:AraC-like DNA-binding protein